MPQLDGIRAVAIFAVLLEHFLPKNYLLGESVHWGRLGVLLFFVLSGFLITRILLDGRDNHGSGSGPSWSLIRNFYFRRMLRIFPIYYLTILVFAVVNFRLVPVKDHLLWHLIYFSNFSDPFIDRTSYYYTIHLWSLCVEEQFYLFWPFLMVFVQKRNLPRIVFWTCVSGVLYKIFGYLAGFSWSQITFPLFGCLESLGFGGLLALYWSDHEKYQKQKSLLINAAIWIGLPLLIASQAVYALSENFRLFPGYGLLVDISASLFFVYLVDGAAQNQKNFFGNFLGLSPVRYIGKISYGIYLYHYFLLPVLFPYVYSLGLWGGWETFLIYSTVTLIVAATSWHLIERPINNLKQYFPYTRESGGNKTQNMNPQITLVQNKS